MAWQQFLDRVIFKSWLSATGKIPWLSHNQMTLRAESFFSINELYQSALLKFNLKLILILLNLYWCQNQRFPFLESTTGSRNSLAIHEMHRHCIGENTFLMKRKKGVMCYKINRLIANLNTGTTWEAFMPVLDWARQLSVPIRPFVLQQCIRVMIFTTFLMLMLSSILRPI